MAVRTNNKSVLGIIILIATGMVDAANVALGKNVTMSSSYGLGSEWSYATDGDTSGYWLDKSCASTRKENNPWMLVDLGASYTVGGMMIYNRVDCCPSRLENLAIRFGPTPRPPEIAFYNDTVPAVAKITFDSRYTGQFLRLEMNKKEYLTICEVEVYEPVDGGWTNWSEWGDCSVSCGSGFKSRSRSCTEPAPDYNGNDCVGPSTDAKACDLGLCPDDGSWAIWEPWSSCTQSCNTGVSLRTRTCTDPAPIAGGADCAGLSSEIVVCNTQSCPNRGYWAEFSAWSECTQSCGTGMSFRTRYCSNPSPEPGGERCIGMPLEVTTCNTQDCPDHCNVVAVRHPENCNDIRVQNRDAVSGAYVIRTSWDVFEKVYCDFLPDHGYMFPSKTALSSLTTLHGLYDMNNHVVIRILYYDGEQHDVEVAQLSMYRGRFPLSIQLNSFTEYTQPLNSNMTPFLFVGFLPAELTSTFSNITETSPVQGYMAAGRDVSFTNCDQTAHSYMAFFGNDGEVAEDDYYLECCDWETMRAWFENDQLVPESRYLEPDDYFFFYEMHFGGCGGYFTSSHGTQYNIKGATVGLGFEYKDCDPYTPLD